jgi:hypothetical protein
MFTTLRHTLANWLDPYRNQKIAKDHTVGIAIGGSWPSVSNSSMNFKVTKASGGYVIESNKYDHVTDQHRMCTYVLMDNCDLGQELAKILTMESMMIR